MVINHMGRELSWRVTWLGPAHAGKATCLRYIHAFYGVRQERGIPVIERPSYHLWFHFMPRVAPIRGYAVRLEMQTLTGEVDASAWAPALAGVDGVVFVADSDPARLSENLRVRELSSALDVPCVFLFNKRDRADALSLADLTARLDVRDAECIEGIATEGRGVLGALDASMASMRVGA